MKRGEFLKTFLKKCWHFITDFTKKGGLVYVQDPQEKSPTEGRLLSLDAYRGFIMLMLIGRAGLGSPVRRPNLAFILTHLDHIEWEGMRLWDLIQPAFMFIVGMAMSFSIASRIVQGASTKHIFRHVIWRAFILLMISQILYSVAMKELTFQLYNVLSQIAFASVLTFLILRLSFRCQVLATMCLLLGHWALFVLFPGAEGPFSKCDNIGAVIDRAVLGFNYPGYYVTINFISSTATMLFGAWVSLLLLKRRPAAYTVKVLAAAAAAAFVGGLILQPFNPMIKRLWTASFTLFSTGWIVLLFLAFYWFVDVKRFQRTVFPFIVVGKNSIFIYCVSLTLQGWLYQTMRVFTSPLHYIAPLAPTIANAILVPGLVWYLCYWLYKRNIFFKI